MSDNTKTEYSMEFCGGMRKQWEKQVPKIYVPKSRKKKKEDEKPDTDGKKK